MSTPRGSFEGEGFEMNSELFREHFRQHPFLEVSADSVRERAYYHWENNTGIFGNTPFANWIQAETEEIFCQIGGVVSPRIDDDQGPPLQFGLHYELVACYTFRHDAPRREVFVPSQENFCNICRREKPRTEFRNRAHVIPESLGNKWLFTKGECDECNGETGRLYENELALYLAALRAFAGIRGKSGAIKLKKSQESRSFIGGQKSGEPLKIVVAEGDDSIKTSLTDNSLVVESFSPAFSPLHAIKSVAKAGFHCLTVEDRVAHDRYRRWIFDSADEHETRYFLAFSPGPGFVNVGLAVWKLRDSNERMPKVITIAFAGNFIIIAPRPDFEGTNARFLLPEMPLSPYPPHFPKIGVFLVKNGQKVRPGPSTTTFSFARMEKKEILK